MWCIGRITAEYRERMYDLLELYAEPYDPAEPVVCLDEKSKQLLKQTRSPIAAAARAKSPRKTTNTSGLEHEIYLSRWNPKPATAK